MFDGLAARAFGGGSEFGKQLDSLADIVTFGVAPGMAIWFAHTQQIDGEAGPALPAAILIIAIASAWRLAKFNIDTRQSMGFLGLPTPSNGLFWASLVLCFTGSGLIEGPGWNGLRNALLQILIESLPLVITAFILGAIMLSEMKLPGLKFKHFRWRGNEVIFILGAIGVVLAALYGMLAVPLILLLYLASPLWGQIFPPTEQ